MSHVTPPRTIHWIGSLCLGIIWGATFMGVAVALRAFSPEWVAAGRLIIGAASLAVVIIVLGDRIGARAYGPIPWKYVIAIGMLSGAVPYLLLSWGSNSFHHLSLVSRWRQSRFSFYLSVISSCPEKE